MVYSVIDKKTKNIHNPNDFTTMSVIHVKYLSARDYLKDFVFNLSIIKPEGLRRKIKRTYHFFLIYDLGDFQTNISDQIRGCHMSKNDIHGHSSKVSQNASD